MLTVLRMFSQVLSWIVLEVLFYVACIASKEEGELTRYSIDNGLLGRRKVQDLKYPSKKIDELVKDLSVEDKERKIDLEELNASVIMMAHSQPTNNKSNAELTYDVGVISEHITIDDQLDSDIIFDDPYVEVNSGQVEHDQDAPD
ncbi:hypothetical protein Tco_1237551 [Tanacetum coccineum]